MIAGPSNTYTGKERFEGYKKALAESGIRLKHEYVIEASYIDSLKEGEQKTKTLLVNAPEITGIFFGADSFAVGGLRALKERNLKVPEDISIVGFADLAEAEFVEPHLTTVRQPKYEIGEQAALLLLKRIDEAVRGVRGKKEEIILKTELIVRESCGYHLRKRG